MSFHNMRRLAWVLVPLLLACVLVAGGLQTAAQEPPVPDVCDDLRYLMDRDITPFDLDIGGGILTPNAPVSSTLTSDMWGDIWAFSVGRPADNRSGLPRVPITITFSGVSSALSAEFAVFQGLAPVAASDGATGYRTIANDTYSYVLQDDGIFILNVRRAHLADSASVGSYQLEVDFPAGERVQLTEIRNNTLNQVFTGQRSLTGGIESIGLSTVVRAPVGSVAGVGMPGSASVVYFGAQSQHNFLVANWAQRMDFLGGDLAVTGLVAGQPRLFYVENYGFEIRADSELLTNFTDSLNTRIATDWSQATGLWVTNTCTGIKFSDGTRFVASTPAKNREVRFGEFPTDDCAAYAITLNAFAQDGTASRYRACMTRTDVIAQAPYDEMTLRDGVYQVYLNVPFDGITAVGDPDVRELVLQTSDLNLFKQPETETSAPFWSIDMADDIRVRLDWLNMKRFQYTGRAPDYTLRLDFLDSPRDTTTRPGATLAAFDAFDDVIHIVYRDEGDTPGAQILMLPAADSYLEILTPAGEPAYNPAALPDQPGYAPRALNNRGGDCYTVNTLLEQANCAPNGFINPANGNLWYAVTDHLAEGYLLDLTLARSYNSFDYQQDSPFGVGWTTNFTPDYNLAYDPVTNTRRIDPAAPGFYRTALDLTWAPRGIVTFETPSGSRHVFVSGGNRFENGTLTAVTMPGWTLSRPTLRDPWLLTQPDGLIYVFDRAGRLLRYGYPDYNRMITVTYPRATLDGPGAAAGQPVLLTDVQDGQALRRIEIFYTGHGHIGLSVLRDLTRGDVAAVDTRIAGLTGLPSAADILCELADNCFATSYTYEQGSGSAGQPVYRLTAVAYPDGLRATYQYDEQQRLTEHVDPRAPVFDTVRYTYAALATGEVAAALVPAVGADAAFQPWRTLTVAQTDTQRRVSVSSYAVPASADSPEPVSTRIYTYDVTGRDLRAAETTFTLAEQTSPLADTAVDDPLTLPERYRWAAGRLTEILLRSLPAGGGRNTTNLTYDAAGLFTGVQRAGYPDFAYTVNEQAALLQFGDDTTVQFTSGDARGLPAARLGRFGAAYTYAWDTRGWLTGLSTPDERFVYDYNDVGLVTDITRFANTAGDDPGHVTHYTYDGLGRLTGMRSDNLVYTLAYDYDLSPGGDVSDCDVATPLAGPAAVHTVTVTDTVGMATRYRFDARARLVEVRTGLSDADYLRRTTYEYDSQNRLCLEYRWLQIASADETALITQYLYEAVPALLPLASDGTETGLSVINGYSVTRIDAYGRRTAMTYDALDRVRETVDAFGGRSRFSYAASTRAANGLQITEHEYRQGALATITEYVFNTQWQLIELRRTVAVTGAKSEWRFSPGADNVNLRDIASPFILASDYSQSSAPPALPAGATFNIVDPITGGASAVDPTLAVAYDAFGRMTRLDQPVNQGDTLTTQVAYCAVAGGRWQVRRSLPNQARMDCAGSVFAAAVTRDAFDNIVEVSDEFGTRRFVYQPDASAHRWLVTVETADSGQWQMLYNAVGDLLEWTDENGITRVYEYDTLGRLLTTRIADAGRDYPEAAYTLTYNTADLLTRIEDGLGRGLSYDYNRFGQVTVEQNLSTSDTTTYVYNTSGQLTSVISPTGSVTNYRYEDPVDPARLTGITTPSGAQEQFLWNDSDQTITYIDALNRQTVYRMDTLGQLRGITDALGQDRQFVYDESGNMVALELLSEGGQALQRFLLQHSPDGVRLTEAAAGDWAWNWTLSGFGTVSGVTPPGGGAGLRLDYDGLGRVTALTAANGDSWQITRGADGIRLETPAGTARAFNYDPLYRLTLDGDAHYRYNASTPGSLRVEQESLDGVKQLYIIASGNGRENIPPRIIYYQPGRYTVYTYDAAGLLTEIERQVCMERGAYVLPALDSPDLDEPASPCLMLAGDAGGSAVWRTVERFIYNESRQLIRAIDSEQNIESFSYDEVGNLITYQNRNGETFTYFYDPLNRLQELVGPTGIRLLLGYNAYDKLIGICQLRVELAEGGEAATYADCLEQTGSANLLVAYEDYFALGYPRQMAYSASGDRISLDYAWGSRFTGWTAGGKTVALAYSDDGLGWLTTVNTGADAYTLVYDDRGELALDALGVLSPFSAAPGDSACVWQTSLTDGDFASYVLSTPGGDLTYILGSNGVIYDILWGTGEVNGISLTYLASDPNQVSFQRCGLRGRDAFFTNTLGHVTQVNYRGDFVLGLNYEITPLGQRLREVIDSQETRLFVSQADGYVVINALDARGYPLATRVSADGENNPMVDGNLLYISTTAYDNNGQLSQEIIQYPDDTLVTIDYYYANLNQLDERIVTITRPLANNQSPVDRYVFTYRYDAAGNLMQADQTGANCTVRYSYDAANRLTGVDGPQGSTTYSYDVQGRVSSINNMAVGYAAGSQLPAFIGEASALARLPGGPDLFRAGAGEIDWLLHDTRTQIIGGDTDSPGRIALLDPLGRPIHFDTPALDANGCLTVFPLTAEHTVLPQQNILVDPIAALYLVNGRAYAPEQAHFLQRSSRGPDTSGSFYSYLTPGAQPPIVRQDAAPMRGLRLLQEARQFSQRTAALTAAVVAQRFTPAPKGRVQTDGELLQQPGAVRRHRLGDALSLAYWLPQAYNLQGVTWDAVSGRLELNQVSAPGHSGAPLPDLLGLQQSVWGPALWSPPAYATGAQLFDRLLTYRQSPGWRAVSYVPDRWQSPVVALDALRANPHPALGRPYTPAAAWEYLPRPLELDESVFQTLKLGSYLAELPAQGGEMLRGYLDVRLNSAVPDLPLTGASWLAGQFSYDTLGTGGLPGMFWELPPGVPDPLGPLNTLFASAQTALFRTPANRLIMGPLLTGESD